ncbi:type II secretion system F family protein [Streptomyces sp. NPDC085596]|uniref:type II secretion system F family protein n=1 Tax=Streptomyces sp. NPDC085596 TaxID=3365731 RepID=UPI0037D5AE4E
MSGDVVHSLGVALAVAVALGSAVRWLEPARQRRLARKRVAGLLAMEPPGAGRSIAVPAMVRRWLPVAGVGCGAWAVVGGAVGALVGIVAVVGLWRWQEHRAVARPAAGADTAAAAGQLPLAAELLAACIESGASPVLAAQAVGEALGGPVGEALARGAAEARLGGEPADAWARLTALPGAGSLARLLERADRSGLPAADPVARLASDARAESIRAATVRARRAAVLISAPVGLCFLPAFIAVGVLPVVIGLAGGALGGGGP